MKHPEKISTFPSYTKLCQPNTYGVYTREGNFYFFSREMTLEFGFLRENIDRFIFSSENYWRVEELQVSSNFISIINIINLPVFLYKNKDIYIRDI